MGSRRRRPGDRLLGRVDVRGQDGLDVVVPLGGGRPPRRSLADDRQDGALDRLGDRLVGGLRAHARACARSRPLNALLAGEALRPCPREDLAGDDPGVAAGAHQRPEADGRRRSVRRARLAGRSASSRAARTVASMFEPVSPSGTGKTLRALISSTWAWRFATALRNASSRPAAVAASEGPSGDVRAAGGESRPGRAMQRRRRRSRSCRRRRAGLVTEALDMDRRAGRARARVARRSRSGRWHRPGGRPRRRAGRRRPSGGDRCERVRGVEADAFRGPAQDDRATRRGVRGREARRRRTRPRAALRTRSRTARRVTRERPGIWSVGTRSFILLREPWDRHRASRLRAAGRRPRATVPSRSRPA